MCTGDNGLHTRSSTGVVCLFKKSRLIGGVLVGSQRYTVKHVACMRLTFLPCSPHAWPSPRKTYAEALWSTAYRNCTELSKECIIGSKWGTITQFNINPTNSQCDLCPLNVENFIRMFSYFGMWAGMSFFSSRAVETDTGCFSQEKRHITFKRRRG